MPLKVGTGESVRSNPMEEKERKVIEKRRALEAPDAWNRGLVLWDI